MQFLIKTKNIKETEIDRIIKKAIIDDIRNSKVILQCLRGKK